MTNPIQTIRAYDPANNRASDPKALSALWLSASLGAHGFLGRARLEEQQTLIETRYLPMAETFVADAADGRPLGFISLLGDFIGGLFVAPEAQGHGIGRALLDHARARRDALELEVYAENAGALRFYRRYGFREISRRAHDDEGLPHANIHMRLD